VHPLNSADFDYRHQNGERMSAHFPISEHIRQSKAQACFSVIDAIDNDLFCTRKCTIISPHHGQVPHENLLLHFENQHAEMPVVLI
jgi:hypothetical protein